MQTSRQDNRPWMSSHNSDQPNPRNLMTTSQLVQGSPASSLSRNCSAIFDSVTLHRQDQFVDPCSMWRLGCSSNHTALDQPHGVIEKRGQPVHGYYFVKAEQEDFFPATMGLNLAGTGTTTYSGGASEETSHGNRFCRTGISACAGSQIPQCQAEGCKANLSSAKHYHRRHKVCEMHSKASTAVVGGLIQRFCQQCSRFHPRSEFDEGKRSCRKRLADHNRRRRKPQPSPCTASQCQAGTTGRLENENQKSKVSSGHDATDVQITANINKSTSTAPSVMAPVPMMMFPNTYKGQIPVLQGTSIDKKSCVEFLYASIAQTGSDLSLEGRIISDNQIESSAYELVHPCSLRPGLLGSEIAGRFSRPAPVDTRYSQSLISMKNCNSNHVTESRKSSLNLPISSSSNDIPAALSSMKNGCSNWILHGSSAEGIRTHAKIPESAESMRSAYDPTPRNDVIKWDAV